ncbi:Os10g0390900 [Oryza sativa Japonica Group]|uniref:Os10g0390900 protein n=1 Tax=Oryza sativa subsp. japonica TaxID=39947 RepID=A0A0P0XU74_ORYSJ|nr:hypothetical protein EE612_051176 [Oryza sativa]BAT10668.1 Os10g0390900 [Oryza sativa Japonica Group]
MRPRPPQSFPSSFIRQWPLFLFHYHEHVFPKTSARLDIPLHATSVIRAITMRRDETWWVLKIDRTEPTSLEIEDLVEVIEKKPRESLQRVQYAKAIDHINNGEQNDVTSASSSTSMNEPKFGIIEILPIVLQKGVLKTNCIDSRDRTNRAQIVDGLVGLGRQLKALVQTKGLEIHIEEPLSSTLMLFYEEMGDALALQFTGSAAQNKEFWKQKGQWSAMNKLTRNIQHFVSNAYMDSEKQNSPNIEVVDVCILFQILGTFPTPTGKASNLEVLAWLAPAKGKSSRGEVRIDDKLGAPVLTRYQCSDEFPLWCRGACCYDQVQRALPCY